MNMQTADGRSREAPVMPIGSMDLFVVGMDVDAEKEDLFNEVYDSMARRSSAVDHIAAHWRARFCAGQVMVIATV
jgi:hypothetical protein